MSDESNHVAEAAERARLRAEAARRDPEPSLGRRFGQIGALGWTIVGPILLGLVIGRALDGWLGAGVTMTAALTFAGAALGLWLAFRWMHQQ
jgi:Putative F0F1-ATPase subunit (ATPase_gene1).